MSDQFVVFFGARLTLKCASVFCLVWSIVCDVDLILVAMSLSWCRLGRFSNSNPGMVPARRRIRSAGS